MQNIQSIAHRIKSDIVAQARQVGCTPQEIAALEEDDFFEDAEAAIRAELAALRFNHRRAIRTASPRQPTTRRAPRRAAKKASASAGGVGDDGDGPAPWSLRAIENFYAFKALPLLSPSLRTSSGEFCKYHGPTILNRIPRVAVSVNCIGEYPTRTFQISWADAATGRHGFSVISLVSHILKITEPAAAVRLARFASNVLATRDARVNVENALERFRIDYVFPFGRRAG